MPSPRPHLDILLVDDSLVSQRLVVRMLERMGHRVTVAENGRMGLEAATQADYDVIFMDVDMPIMNGLEATRAIRRHERGGFRTPIIGVTSNPDKEACLQAGMDEFFSKTLFWSKVDGILSRISNSSAA